MKSKEKRRKEMKIGQANRHLQTQPSDDQILTLPAITRRMTMWSITAKLIRNGFQLS